MNFRFTSYPIFRLLLALVAGILLADAFPVGTGSFPVLFLAVGACVALCCLWFRWGNYRLRMLFGLSANVCFALLGSLLLVQARDGVRYEWLPAPAAYMGLVDDVPQQAGKTFRATVKVDCVQDRASGAWTAVNRTAFLYFVPDSAGNVPVCGQPICFHARIRKPASDDGITGFDYRRYLECKGIGGTAVVFPGQWMPMMQGGAWSLRREALQLRARIVETYRSWGMDDDVLGVVSALTVGDKSELDGELKATYSAAGASHVLALSGLHIGILAVILSGILYPLRGIRGGRWIVCTLVSVMLWAFAFLSGLSPSVVRAVLMFTLCAVAYTLTESRFSGFLTVSLSAFLMLLYNPLYLFDVSFQLSYAAVYSILLLYPIFPGWMPAGGFLLRRVWQVATLSLAAQLGTLPFVLHYFGTFPTYFLLSNLVVAPLAVSILAGTLGALCLASVPLIGGWAVGFLSLSAQLLNEAMDAVSRLAGAQITSIYFTVGQSVLLGGCVLLCVSFLYKHSAFRLVACLCCFNLLVGSLLYDNLNPPRPHVCLARSAVYTVRGREAYVLSAPDGLYQVGGLRLVLLDHARWKGKYAPNPLSLDYAYVCRGFRGTVQDLSRLFRMHTVVLDGSLSDGYKSFLKRECEALGQNYIDISEKGSYVIYMNKE